MQVGHRAKDHGEVGRVGGKVETSEIFVEKWTAAIAIAAVDHWLVQDRWSRLSMVLGFPRDFSTRRLVSQLPQPRGIVQSTEGLFLFSFFFFY